jgi:hypothetical protein
LRRSSREGDYVVACFRGLNETDNPLNAALTSRSGKFRADLAWQMAKAAYASQLPFGQ